MVRVLFSDESSRFHLSTADRRVRVFRRKGGRVAQKCLSERDRFGVGSVIVWGGIMGGRKMDLVIINGNLNVQGYACGLLLCLSLSSIQGVKCMPMQDHTRPDLHKPFLPDMTLTSCHGQHVLRTYISIQHL